jgi:hypothetical protein
MAWLRQMTGYAVGRYVLGRYKYLSVVGAMARSWRSHLGEFQHTLLECWVPWPSAMWMVTVPCAGNRVLPFGDAWRQNAL